MPTLVRAFVAVEIPREVQDKAGKLIAALDGTEAKVRWVEPLTLHWTLQFLGDVDLREIPAVCDRVAKAVAPFAPFDIAAHGVGAFPNAEKPRTLWIGMQEGSDQMIALHDAIGSALGEIGYREEARRFRPHLTIGRVRSSPAGNVELAARLAENTNFDGGLTTISEVVVLSSELTRKGPVYELLGHGELRG